MSVRVKAYPDIAHAQDGQQGLAAQRQVSLHVKAVLQPQPRGTASSLLVEAHARGTTLSSPHKWLTISSTTPKGSDVRVALPEDTALWYN